MDHKALGIILGRVGPAAPPPGDDAGDGDEALIACAADLLAAIEAKDARGIAQAWRDAFAVLESEPHEEGPHEGA